MAIAVNISNITKKLITDGSEQLLKTNSDEIDHLLLIINSGTLKTEKSVYAKNNLTRNSNVSCGIRCHLSDCFLTSEMDLSGVAANVHYEISLSYIDSEYNPQFLETLRIRNVTPGSIYSFTGKYNFDNKSRKVDSTSGDFYEYCAEHTKSMSNHLCLYFQITKKGISPFKVPITIGKMPEGFLSLYKDKLLTDYKIICENGEFLVHKTVLAARSSVFRERFKNPENESQRTMTKLLSCYSYRTVEQMVHYLYTDEIMEVMTEEELIELLSISQDFELKNLELLCLHEITKYAQDFNTAVELLTFAARYCETDSREALIEFIKDNKYVLFT